jgi:hypothetical protein
MAAVTTAVVAGAGILLSVHAQQEAKKANQKAADMNAADSERNAELARLQGEEDARQFRLSFRRDQARNIAQVGASGVKMEGSPLEVLQDNVISAERDYQNIKAGGAQQRESYLRQAGMYRQGGKAMGEAADIGTAATVLNGAAQVYGTGTKSGAWS